jgi:membrane-associated phospholipid phosphatase
MLPDFGSRHLHGAASMFGWVPKRLVPGALAVALMHTPLAAQVPAAPAYPAYNTAKEIAITATGAALFIASQIVSFDPVTVPPEGLDPGEIRWSIDRNTVGNLDHDANVASDWTRVACIALPGVLTLAIGPTDERWGRLGRRLPVYAEAFLGTQGLTALAKRSIARARPYAYVPEADRPDEADYDVTLDRTFYAMPSGHASAAWTGVALALTEHLLARPTAGWKERAVLGFVGGGLAGATAGLRVEGGQHFPTDVATGAVIGIAGGVTIPLLHRGATPLPSSRAWLATAGGTLAGVLVAALVVR